MIPETNAKTLILLFYILKHCFLGSFLMDSPSLCMSFRSGQYNACQKLCFSNSVTYERVATYNKYVNG